MRGRLEEESKFPPNLAVQIGSLGTNCSGDLSAVGKSPLKMDLDLDRERPSC